MRKRRPIIIGILATVLIAGVVWSTFRSREPVYQSKPLSAWLQQFATNLSPDENQELAKQAETAIRQIGTNAIPIYSDMIASRESAFRVNLLAKAPRRWLKKLHIQNTDEYKATLARRRNAGAAGLIALGPDAQPAIPALIKCLEEPDWNLRANAVVCLGKIHKDPQRVIPALLDFIKLHRSSSTHPDPVQCTYAIQSISVFGSDAKMALPMITELVDDQDALIRDYALQAIQAIDPQPETLLPILLRKLHDSQFGVRATSARILSELFPEEAEKAGVYKTYPIWKPSITNTPAANK